ncbi:MAG: hypothetical protein MUO85_05370 [candidate division Zixibacteria bacterium]|nr:hypothetical protein [candidate division Zixibacteria bacterium]
MKNVSIFLVVGLCLLLFIGCANKPVSPVSTYKFTIDGVLVKDMNLMQDIAYFIVQRDSLPFDSADVIVEGDTLESYGSGEYYLVGPFTTFHPNDTLDITITSESDSVTFTKKIIMPDTFRITDIAPGRLNPGGGSSVIYWTASQYASGYFVVVSNPPAVGHNALVDYNSTQEEILQSAFQDIHNNVIPGIYSVYVVSYRESFLLYDPYFDLPNGLPRDNLQFYEANGTIGAGVIAPKDSIIVP